MSTAPDVTPLALPPGDNVPNHPHWPLLVYRQAIAPDADAAERMLTAHGWVGAWRNGVYPYAHYHTTAHEVLACVRGTATIRFGGTGGEAVSLRAGDVVVLPAGTGHERQAASDDFLVVGAYPRGQEDWDLQRDAPTDADRARIDRVPRPEADPVFGDDGPLLAHWVD